eukprot:m.232737 g.232737  ORF g.232737 m.232737 type:complete len:446 (-) comp26493_c0_seq5:1120-2457(-)
MFICRGTRGDIEPLAVVAQQWRNLNPQKRCAMAAPAAYAALLEGSRVDFLPLPEDGACPLCDKCENQLKRRKIDSCRNSSCDHLSAVRALHGSLEVARKFKPTCIVFNLFAFEGWSVSQRLSLPCLAMSPFLPHRTAPAQFEQRLEEAHPTLFRALLGASPSEAMSISDVRTWFWRLFLNDHGHARETIGLHPSPLLQFEKDGQEEKLLSSQPPCKLLIGISDIVLPKPLHYSVNVLLTGYWFDALKKSCSNTTALLCNPIFSGQLRVLYVTFGSMEKLGLVDERLCKKIAALLKSAIKQLDVRVVIQTHTQSPLIDFCKEQAEITCVTTNVDHGSLFPHVDVVLHHGGAQTVGRVLCAGKPQLIFPFIFDQSFWASHLEWQGLNTSSIPLKDIKESTFLAAIKKALSRDMQRKTQDVAKKLCESQLRTLDDTMAAISEICAQHP